ncbi:transcriptional regulator FNR, partial [Salmonella enterica subsp. enterica serovar Give]
MNYSFSGIAQTYALTKKMLKLTNINYGLSRPM